jgi:hypothetical protein
MDTARKAQFYDMIKDYLEGSLSVELESDFARAYQQGLRSLKGYIDSLEKSAEDIACY